MHRLTNILNFAEISDFLGERGVKYLNRHQTPKFSSGARARLIENQFVKAQQSVLAGVAKTERRCLYDPPGDEVGMPVQ